MTERLPPHDLDAEESILGAAIASEDARDVLLAMLRPEDYHALRHGDVHRAIAELAAEREPIDGLTVAVRVARNWPDDADPIATRARILSLPEASPVWSNARTYAAIVRRHAVARRLDAALAAAHGELHRGADPAEIGAVLDREINELLANERSPRHRLHTVPEGAQEWVDDTLEDLREGKIRTGWPGLDLDLKAPIRRGEVIAVAARSGIGKTWALLDLLAGILDHRPSAWSLLMTLEMPRVDIFERIAGQTLRSPSDELRKVVEEAGPERRVESAVEIVDKMLTARPAIDRMRIVDGSQGVADIPRLMTAAKREGIEPLIVGIDYSGLLRWDGHPNADDYTRVSQTFRALKPIAIDLGIVIVAAVQLSRAAGSGGVRVTKAMMRDSGAIEESSDRILGFWAPSKADGLSDADRRSKAGIVNAIWVKNRKGPEDGDPVELHFARGHRLIELARNEAA